MNTVLTTKETYRDSVATISKDGKRNFIRPKKPRGKFYSRRTWFSIFYLVIFFTLPFLKLNNEPFFLINFFDRKFILFGMIFWPQDFFIFGIAMLNLIVFIIVFTVGFGRIFCGWACPQTIFMEMVFRKIEYLIDGDAARQKILKMQVWNSEKIVKRTLKLTIFFTLSFVIANFFLAYIIGMDQLFNDIANPAANFGTLSSLIIFTTIFFLVYWWFREQACIVVCPYGRLQGVLLDKQSIVVAYDYIRGEPRGKLKVNLIKNNKSHDCKCTDCKGDGGCNDVLEKLAEIQPVLVKGDCINCNSCVAVCPTGIDIRNGTQLECINCTACIDACDAIMTSIHKPTGLIRYASESTIGKGRKLKFTNRLKAYTVVLSLLIVLLVALIATRTDLDARLMRTSGMTYTSLPDGRVENLYNLKIANKTHKDIRIQLKLENLPGEIVMIGSEYPVIKGTAYTTIQFFVKVNRSVLKGWRTPVFIGLYDTGEKIRTVTAKFIGPEVYGD